MKDVRCQGGGLFSADILRTKRRGILQIRTSALFGAKKNFGFFEIYAESARVEVESVRTFCGQGEVLQYPTPGVGLIFRDFARTSFMDTWTAPNLYS